MLRSPKPGDWAAEDDDADGPELPTTQAPPTAAANSSSRETQPQAPRNRWNRAPDAPARRDGGGGYDRRDGGGYDRRDGGGGYDRRDGGGYDRRDGGGYDRRDGGYDRRDGGYDRYDRRDGGYDRRDGGGSGRRQQQQVELPKEQGVVIAIKESFGFVRCGRATS